MRKFILALSFIILSSTVLYSHPHMYIDMKVSPVFSEERFEGVRINWLFDMVFTGSVLMDNGIGWKEDFTEDEIELIRDTSFINLVNYNYFTYFNIANRISRAVDFSDFNAYMSENRLGYDFFLPYNGNNSDAEEIRIAVYDETFFCDIAYTDLAPVSLKAPDSKIIEWKLSEKQDAPIFYDNSAQMVSRDGADYSGQAFPIELVLTVEK